SSRRRHTRFDCDWSSDVCSSDLFPPDDRHGMPGFTRVLSHVLDAYRSRRKEVQAASDEVRNVINSQLQPQGTRAIEKEALYRARSEERRVGKEGRGRRST